MSHSDDYAWAYYADLQHRSSKVARLTPHWWAMEAGMSYLLDAIAAGAVPSDSTELTANLNRTIASAARLYRGRRATLSRNKPHDSPPAAGDVAAEARIELTRAMRIISKDDKHVLFDAGLGYTDREIAERQGSTPGAVRVRISRLRLKIAA
jgi:DNA-binding NarL/FixJ family response regulator